MILRHLARGETDLAAVLHRHAAALIPDYPNDLHTPAEDREYYAGPVFARGPIWGAWLGGRLIGHMAVSPGWIDHLYVDTARQGTGVGRALVAQAQAEQPALQLWTFQSNARARRFYAANGFVEVEWTDGAGNEEGMPDVRMEWRRG